MFRNFLKIAIRNLRKNKGLSFINIFGLAVSIACCLLILLFIRHELSYDKYHKNADRTYRVVKDFVNDDGTKLPDATTPPALATFISKEIPEVEAVTRVFPGWGRKYLMKYGDKRFIEEKIYRVDSNFFDVFTFPFAKGDSKNIFKAINTVIITESIASKYFGLEDPIGKVLTTELGDLEVTGVTKDIPDNTHFHFDFLITIRKIGGNIDENWGFYNFYTYIRIKENTSIKNVDSKIQALYKANNEDATNQFYSQALTGIHLTSNLKWELEPNSDRMYIYIFSVIGLFIIVIASINYVNLSTARSSLRAKEIGVRKVNGAYRISLVKQFLMESVLTVILSLVVALIFAALLLPIINQLTQKNLSMSTLLQPSVILMIVAGVIVIGLMAGLFPALYLSSFKPVIVLKGFRVSGNSIFNLRKGLVVLQFTISVILITGTLIVIKQIRFIQNAKLGIDKEQVMLVQGANQLSTAGSYEGFRNDLLQIPSVKKVAGADGVIGGQNWTNNMTVKGSETGQLVNFLTVGYDYMDVMGMQIIEGRGFSSSYPADTLQNGDPTATERQSGGIILNETAVKELKVPSPVVGQLIEWAEDEDTTYYLKVVGLVKDFHFTSLRNDIKPFAFVTANTSQSLYTIKLQTSDLSNSISSIEKIWNKYSPDRPFQYSFLDETFSRLYSSEVRFNRIFLSITILAIIIACLGLFGLTAFMIEQRTKEIGIRKVIGASVTSIVTLLSKDFVRLVLIAIVIAIPIAWYFMNKWLQDFAYRIDIGWWIFGVAGFLAVMIAIITVSFQAIRAAIANPVKSLRTE